MTRRRVVAFAQALTMIMLLLPGPHAVGPSSLRAAFEPVETDAVNVFDAAGRGIGCQAGTRRYKGPGLPKDPPWPPGAKPTPTPEPTVEPSLEPAGEQGGEPSPEPAAPTALGPTAYVAATDVRVVQAELEGGPAASAPPSDSRELIKGIDVSHHNGDIDFASVKAAGYRFVLMKATQDNDFSDPRFLTNMAAARAAGLAAGAYHFFDYTLDGRAQADHFIDRLEAAGGVDDLLPPVVDVECWAPIGASIHAVAATRLRDFVARVYERTGRLPVIYTSVYMWRQVVGNAEGFEEHPLWAACWGCEEPISIPPGWDDWTFWQTTISGSVPGISGRVDGNFFGGGRKDLEALKLRPLSLESGAIATSRERAAVDLGGRDASHLRTSSDGESWSGWSRIGSEPTVELPTAEGEVDVFVQLRNGPGLVSPVLSDSILIDHTPPSLSQPVVSLRTGALGDEATRGVPVAVAWQARDAAAGLSDASVLVDCGPTGTMRSEAPGSAAPDEPADWLAEDALAAPDATCTATAIGRDGAGNTARAESLPFSIELLEATGDAVEGTQVGVIARRGPDAGRVAVLLDGVAVGLADLYAAEETGPQIVFVAQLPAGSHVISVEATGSDDPAAGGVVVPVDGFVTLAG